MFALLALGLLLGAMAAGWLLMRKAARLTSTTRIWMASLLAIPISLAIIELRTGYSLASSYAPTVVLPLSIVAYVLELFFLWHWKRSRWHWNRIAAAVGIGGPLLFLVTHLQDVVLLAVVMAGTSGISPVASERISPSLSYTVVADHALFGGSAFYAYRIYRNPTWLPLVEKRVSEGPLPCGTSWSGMSMLPGRDPHVLTVQCKNNGQEPFTQEVRLD